MSQHLSGKNTTLKTLIEIRERGEKFACLTAYDACFASILSDAGVDAILVGDSLGMVLQGHDSTLPVTMEDMMYHMSCVKRGNRGAFLMADLPFMSYASEAQTLENAAALMRAGAQMVKLEGGAWIANTTRSLAERGIPVCAHMGLTPQSINRIGGYHVQGRDTQQAQKIIDEARVLQDAGASILLLECVPTSLAKTITDSLQIPVIGIGAGPDTTAQIMVLHDVLGIS
ncbi:MAG: 3-methyl-2-oxobutanoate hydroxymethyltransferase, partial [Gammaproteobacteria bacterium]|nr:3-methyl-2-oxobutanoate hydroxymethyltransferase [Gammaproteobacteria bacterium]